MRFTLSTPEQKRTKKLESFQKWHKKFAWKPLRMSNNPEIIVWMEFVLRKGRPRQFTPKILWDWEYVESTLDVLKMDR